MEETENILICHCESAEHQIIIRPIDDLGLIFLEIHLSSLPLHKRIVNGLKYIFGYSSMFGHWEEFIFKKEHKEKLQKIVDNL